VKTPAALLLCALSLSCGSNKSSTPSGPQSLNNGATLATVTSYWANEECVPGYVMGIEFAANDQFQTIITGSGPGSTTCVGNVGQYGQGGYLTLGGSCSGATGPNGSYMEIEEITSISGSTASGSMTASLTTSMQPGVTASNCAFTLVQGKQP